MSGVLRSGVRRLVGQSATAAKATQNQTLLKSSAVLPAALQACHISGRASHGPEKRVRPAPYDYVNKDYTFWHALFDKTTHRFDDNSKVLVCESTA